MSMCTSELYPHKEQAGGFSCKVTIETGERGFGRLNVACLKPETDDVENSQGADLTASECRTLAQMLLATACLIETIE